MSHPTFYYQRLTSATRSRGRLLSRQSRTPDLVKQEVSGLTIRVLEEDGDVTPKVCQLDSVRELDEDKEAGELTEGYWSVG